MVKKIRLIDDNEQNQENTQTEFQTVLLETLKSMDWKLWEILKIEQARAQREGLVDVESNDTDNLDEQSSLDDTNLLTTNIKSIIVDEDEHD